MDKGKMEEPAGTSSQPIANHDISYASHVHSSVHQGNDFAPLVNEIGNLPDGLRQTLLSALQIPIDCLASSEKISTWLLTLLAQTNKQCQSYKLKLRKAKANRNRLRSQCASAEKIAENARTIGKNNEAIAHVFENLKQGFEKTLIKPDVPHETPRSPREHLFEPTPNPPSE